MTESRVLTAAILALGLARMAPAAPSVQRAEEPETYGTSVITYYAVDASSFSLESSAFHYGCTNNCWLRYVKDSTGDVMTAPLHLPAGAAIVSMEIDYYDGSTTGQVSASLASCDTQGSCTLAEGANCSLHTVCSGDLQAPGFFSSATDLTPVVIDNAASRYFIVAGTSTTDSSTAISQVILGYTLQVSLPSGIPTFTDVPTSDPLFQYVEALAASGVTGGCGGGKFCPNATLTRGQMAVFLAKALGLQWP